MNAYLRDPRSLDPPENCADGHDFQMTGEAADGTTFWRCRRCGVRPDDVPEDEADELEP